MKKFLITLLAAFYLGVSSGATVHFHYCMGQLIDWSFSQEKSESADSCSNCGMSEGASGGCCKDKKQEYKVKEFQKTAPCFYQPKVFSLESIAFSKFLETQVSPVKGLYHLSNPPPRTQKAPFFLRNCNFRI